MDAHNESVREPYNFLLLLLFGFSQSIFHFLLISEKVRQTLLQIGKDYTSVGFLNSPVKVSTGGLKTLLSDHFRK